MSSERLNEFIEENIQIIQEYFDFGIKVFYSQHIFDPLFKLLMPILLLPT
jgi:hypothetical protein